jgi:hypothetical protein
LNRETIANGRFNMLMLIALALAFLVTTIGGLQRIFDTVELDGDQWAGVPHRGRWLLRPCRARQGAVPPLPEGPRHMTDVEQS